jgi:leucyl aminopeptidase
MKYSCRVDIAFRVLADSIVLFVSQTQKVDSPRLKQIDKAINGSLTTLVNSGEFTGKDGEISVIYHPTGFRAHRLVLAGIGEKKKLQPEALRRAAGNLSRHKAVTSAGELAVDLDGYENAGFAQAVVEGLMLGSHKFLDYKTGESARETSKLREVALIVPKKYLLVKTTREVERGRIIAEGQLLVRRLSATPSNDLTPRLYAAKIAKLAKEHGVSCRILDEKAIAVEKMGGLLGVSKGSEEPPRFVVLKYQKAGAKTKPIVLVGKGVTFDTGGISLKPAENMHEMKQDMTGSAVMLATILTAARLKLPLNLVALLPITENMPSGHASKPGDVLVMRGGKTVEIINTDAEGRLILADALDYAKKFDPQAVFDIATLTGAALFILGYSGAPILGNNIELVKRVEAASKATSERVWHLPIWDDHREQMKSPVADLVNSGGRPAGTIAASAFLENFIGDWPWLHIDIAWMDMEYQGKAYTPKGASGFGVRLLTEMLANWKKM